MKEGECHELTCNSHVVLLQLQRQPAVPMKRKRRYCEFPELDVLSSGVADGSDQYSYTVSDSVSLSLYVFLFHSGRLKERTLSSHQTAVSSRHWRLIHFREEFSFENGLKLARAPPFNSSFAGGELQWYYQPVSTPRYGAFDQQWEVWKEHSGSHFKINYLMHYYWSDVSVHGLCFSLCARTRSFVVKHHVFLVRNWELVRDRQIRMRIERERERDAEAEEEDSRRLSFDRANGDDSHIKSGPWSKCVC